MPTDFALDREGSGVSPLWEKTAPPLTPLQALQGEHEFEIAIVGAGVAGLSVAYHLTQLGVTPVVLESLEPGVLATGRSGGIIASLPARASPVSIIEQYGQAEGKQLLMLFANSGGYTFKLIDELGLDCSPQPQGFLAPAKAGKNLITLQKICQEWHSLGFDMQYADADRTAELSGLDGYGGAIIDPNGGGVNPLAYARELARASEEAGAKIFIRSPVEDFVRRGKSWQLNTAQGKIKAQKVVLCAGGGNRQLFTELKKSLLPLKVFEFSTEPLADDIRAQLLPQGHSLTDIHTDIFTMRYDRDGRLITACPALLFNNAHDKAITTITRRLKRISPLLENVRIENVWQGTAWIAMSFLPKFYNFSDGLFAVQACNGRGLALNTLLGSEVALNLASSRDDKASLVSEYPGRIFPYRLIRHAPRLTASAAHYGNLIADKIKGCVPV